jgi:folate-binding protein YgfZ
MSSNHIEQLRPGGHCYAFFLNAQGRILGDANILCFEDRLELDTEPEAGRQLFEHIDKYIIADDVTLEDVTAQTAVLAIEGPGAEEAAARAGLDHGWGLSHTGAPGRRWFLPADVRVDAVARLTAAGIPQATLEEARAARIANGRPRYGEEVTGRFLVQETQLLHAVSFNKGCYLGQEIVERVRSRGQVHRLLVPVEIEAETPLPPGSEALAAGAKVGELVSSVFLPDRGNLAGFAYVRADYAQADAPLDFNGVKGRVTAPAPA